MKRIAVVAATVLSIGLTAAIAWAYLASSGAGTGNATVLSLQAVTISATTATPTTALLPGTSGDVTFRISNPNTVSVTIVSVAGNGTISASGAAGCNGANAGVSFTDQTGLSIAVPPSAVNFAVDLPSAASMSSSSSNLCQDASFQIPVLVTVHRG